MNKKVQIKGQNRWIQLNIILMIKKIFLKDKKKKINKNTKIN